MVKILQGDCLEVIKTLPDESVNCCVTSPPYWGLRDYGVEGQLGLERTPEEYVSKMVDVFREVRRVLRGDGVAWINLGDSYVSSPAGNFGHDMPAPADGGRYRENKPKIDYPKLYKPKDLCGIPWMVAFALRADGWYLRQDIIWAKPNPMPESVTDRCTKAHEYIFLMSKSQRYFYDAAAIAEDSIWKDPRTPYGSEGAWELDGRAPEKRNGGKVRKSATKGPFNGKTEAMAETGQNAIRSIVDKRNRRSVWTVSTAPFPGAHFATFPPKLIEPCILAGCPVGGTVLDPFGGSGTVGMVAENNGRNSILIELNQKYVDMAKRRTAQHGIFC